MFTINLIFDNTRLKPTILYFFTSFCFICCLFIFICFVFLIFLCLGLVFCLCVCLFVFPVFQEVDFIFNVFFSLIGYYLYQLACFTFGIDLGLCSLKPGLGLLWSSRSFQGVSEIKCVCTIIYLHKCSFSR